MGSFRNHMKLDEKQGELVQLMRKSCHEVTMGFFSTNAPNTPHWTLNSCFGALHSVWVHLLSFGNCMKLDAKRGKLVPPHWTLNSCFHKFHSVWVHLLSFRNYMKHGAKWCELVQLMQKFVPRSHIRIFRNESTQSTPLDPKLMFWCVA